MAAMCGTLGIFRFRAPRSFLIAWLRVGKAATGHGLGKPKRMLAAEFADMLAFAADHTGLTPGLPGDAPEHAVSS